MSITQYCLDSAKATIDDLAIFGGRPAFENTLHVGRPNIGDRQRFLKRVSDILDRQWLTNGGVYLNDFEQRIAEFTNTEHCIAVSNATTGLQLTIRALGMTGEVILPSFTAVATAHAVQWQNITPIFCDIDPRSHTLHPESVEQMITPRTTGIIGVHLWGNPCNIDALSGIARRRGLKLIFRCRACVWLFIPRSYDWRFWRCRSIQFSRHEVP